MSTEEPRRSTRKRKREPNNEPQGKIRQRKSTTKLRLKEKIESELPANEYVLNEIVLCTIPRFSPWPARIMQINGHTIIVEFFGTGQMWVNCSLLLFPILFWDFYYYFPFIFPILSHAGLCVQMLLFCFDSIGLDSFHFNFFFFANIIYFIVLKYYSVSFCIILCHFVYLFKILMLTQKWEMLCNSVQRHYNIVLSLTLTSSFAVVS